MANNFRYYNFNWDNESKMGSLKLFGVSAFSFYYKKGFFWFRLLGSGLVFKNTKLYLPDFGERYNHISFVKLGNWIIKSTNS